MYVYVYYTSEGTLNKRVNGGEIIPTRDHPLKGTQSIKPFAFGELNVNGNVEFQELKLHCVQEDEERKNSPRNGTRRLGLVEGQGEQKVSRGIIKFDTGSSPLSRSAVLCI